MSQLLHDDKTLARFKELILGTCGFSLEKGREQTLIQGVRERMAARGVERAEAYHALLLSDRRELNGLVELLTVNETYFFREPDHLNLAVDKLLPELLSLRRGRPVRIVSAGCSTGEEPYSIAILLRERYGADSGGLFAIAGVDIDSGAIACARRGVYGRGSFRGVEQGIMERYFQPAEGGEFRVEDAVRKLVHFQVANLLGPAYPPEMEKPDLIFYRNVSIYFPGEVQGRIFGKLAGLLSEGGYLMVGASETIHHNLGILSLVERDALFFYRKGMLPPREERLQAGHGLKFGSRPTAAGTPAARVFPVPCDRFAPQATRPVKAEAKPLPVPLPGAGEGFDEALGLARTGATDKALQLLDALLGREPSLTRARVLRGSLLLNSGRDLEAAKQCREIVEDDPLCLEACLMLGIATRHQGDDEEAFRRFRQALYLDASCWPAHFYSAEILYGQGEGRRARGGYESALRVLEKGSRDESDRALMFLPFNAEQFMAICRHKLSILTENG